MRNDYLMVAFLPMFSSLFRQDDIIVRGQHLRMIAWSERKSRNGMEKKKRMHLLEHKWALVTGSSRGVGQQIALGWPGASAT
jgi:hypothetical protein